MDEKGKQLVTNDGTVNMVLDLKGETNDKTKYE